MKKILLLAITILFYIVLGVLGWVISQSLTNIVGFPSNVLVWVAILCSIIYAYRKNKDAKWEYELIGSNLLGTDSRTSVNVNNISRSINETFILPRFVSLRLRYQL